MNVFGLDVIVDVEADEDPSLVLNRIDGWR